MTVLIEPDILSVCGYLWRICSGAAERPIVAKCTIGGVTLVARAMTVKRLREVAAKRIAEYESNPDDITKYEDIP